MIQVFGILMALVELFISNALAVMTLSEGGLWTVAYLAYIGWSYWQSSKLLNVVVVVVSNFAMAWAYLSFGLPAVAVLFVVFLVAGEFLLPRQDETDEDDQPG